MNVFNEFARNDGLKMVEAAQMVRNDMPEGRTLITRNSVEDRALDAIDEQRRSKAKESATASHNSAMDEIALVVACLVNDLREVVGAKRANSLMARIDAVRARLRQ
jgi:hypothetical protein